MQLDRYIARCETRRSLRKGIKNRKKYIKKLNRELAKKQKKLDKLTLFIKTDLPSI